MGKKKRAMNKTMPGHNDVKTTKFRTHAWTFMKLCWCWFKKHFPEFIVTMFGVWAAFGLAGWSEQRALNKTTQQRLMLTQLESRYNSIIARRILDGYADPNRVTIHVNRPTSTATLITLQDTNVMKFLPLVKVSMLKSYVNCINVLNQSLQVYDGIVETQNYKNTTHEESARLQVRTNAAFMLGMITVLQKELYEYVYDKDKIFDEERADKMNDRVKYIQRQALKGEFPLSKEQTKP
ncbi:MAG: hypothetical protein WBC05_07495 [Sedimentisphaerales bacterium]